MIECQDLQGRSGQFLAGPVNVSITEPVTAIIGPNGSGKTTFIETLLGWRRVSGSSWFDSTPLDPSQTGTFARIVYIGDYFPEMLLPMKAHQFIYFLAHVRYQQFGAPVDEQLTRAFDYLDLLGLPLRSSPVSGYSLGMKRKLQLVAGLMQAPDLLIVDEPQIGLDFRSSATLREIFQDFVGTGDRQILMSNHDLDSVARSADRVIALDHGQITKDIDASAYNADSLERELETAFGVRD